MNQMDDGLDHINNVFLKFNSDIENSNFNQVKTFKMKSNKISIKPKSSFNKFNKSSLNTHFVKQLKEPVLFLFYL